MAMVLGAPLRPSRFDDGNKPLTNLEKQMLEYELEMKRFKEECARERSLKTKARHALVAVKDVVSAVRACGSRIAFRYRNRAPYPRQCSAPPAVFVTEPLLSLSAVPAEQLDAMMKKLETEEAGLMEKLRELWQHLAVGAHLQPAFADPDRLAHVTHLLLEGNTDAVERDPDNDEVSGAATMRLTSVRLEAALLEVHEQMQAVCRERRRRKDESDRQQHRVSGAAAAAEAAATEAAAAALAAAAAPAGADWACGTPPPGVDVSTSTTGSPRCAKRSRAVVAAASFLSRSRSFLAGRSSSLSGASLGLVEAGEELWLRHLRAGAPAGGGPCWGSASPLAAAEAAAGLTLPCSRAAYDGAEAVGGYCIVRVHCRSSSMPQ